MYSALELTNRLRAEAGRVSESGLPLEVFPQRVQEIIFNLATYENFGLCAKRGHKALAINFIS